MLQDLKIYVPTGCGNFPVLCEILGVYSFKTCYGRAWLFPHQNTKKNIVYKYQTTGKRHAARGPGELEALDFENLQENHVGLSENKVHLGYPKIPWFLINFRNN